MPLTNSTNEDGATRSAPSYGSFMANLTQSDVSR